jgi:hypothetical protein
MTASQLRSGVPGPEHGTGTERFPLAVERLLLKIGIGLKEVAGAGDGWAAIAEVEQAIASQGPHPEHTDRNVINSPDNSIVKGFEMFDNGSHKIEMDLMSRRTQFFAVGLFAAVSVASVHAGADGDADLGGVNRAMNDLYKGARDSSDKSPAAIRQLKQQTIEPAVQKKVEAARASLSNPAGAGAGGGRSHSYGNEDSGGGNGPEPVSGPIMDAKDVPAELEFPGAPKALPSSKPAGQKR